MRIATLSTATLVALAALAASPASAADAFGTWLRPSTGATVSFYDCGGKLCAKIVGQKDAAKKDTIGKVIMSGATKTGANSWKGSLLNVDNGQTYAGVVTLEGPKALKLEGCVLGGVICTGETWTKVN
jgi:uncharacterized protein (DUF2147 family)